MKAPILYMNRRTENRQAQMQTKLTSLAHRIIASQAPVNMRSTAGHRTTRRRKNSVDQIGRMVAAPAFDKFLESFLALDRTVMEVFMHAYGTPPCDQFAMREQNRQLHEVVRERLPQILSGCSR